MNVLEKESKEIGILNAYQKIWKEYGELFWDGKLDITMNEFIVIDDYMKYVAGLLEEFPKIDIVPKLIIDEFDKIGTQK